MKLYIFLLFCSISLAQATNSYAQKATVNLKMQNQTVQAVLDEIENQSEFSFFFNTRHVDLNRRVSVDANKSDIFKVLDNIFAGTNVRYSVVDKKIILSTEKAISQQTKKKVTGVVKDQNGEPVIGANVSVKETTNGTITDIDGNFSLDNISNKDIIVISYIGYISQEIAIDQKTTLKVVLQEDQQTLEEVVVIGYGAVKKKDLTGAIAQVKADKYATQQSTNVLDMLNGTVAGFNSNIGTSASGASEMEIRGPASLSANNSPLIVLDGVIFNGSINDINPSDIETIDVLKDASSAAVYGSRSAAGVVIINTKQGKGDKMSINFSAQLGLTDFTNEIKPNDLSGFIQRRQDFQRRINPDKPEGYYNNPNQLPKGIDVDIWQKYDASFQSDPILTWMTRLNLRDIEQQNYLNGNAYDWYGEATRPGLRQNYNVNISGGIGKTKYYWSLGYTDNQGYIKGDEYKTIRSRINADTKVTEFLTVGINLATKMKVMKPSNCRI